MDPLQQALRLDPRNAAFYLTLGETQMRLATALASGDTAGTLAYFATYSDLGWIFDSAQERTLLASGVAAFDGSRTQWAIVYAEQYARRHDAREMKIWAHTDRLELERELKDFPNDAQRVAFHGLMLAYLGHSEEAAREGKGAVKLLPDMAAVAYSPSAS